MTSWFGWALRRARASTGLLLTLLALVLATTAILAGSVGYSGAAATTAAREALTGAVPSEAGIRVQTRQADDAQAQDTAARRLIDEAFDPAPISVQRTVVTDPRPVSTDGERVAGELVALSSDTLTPAAPGVAERVDIVDGGWPEAGAEPIQGLLHAAAADEWGVTVGDTIDVSGTPVDVMGLWRPADPADPYWFGDALVATGRDGDQRGPLVVAPGAVAQLVDAPFVRWTVQPDASQIQPEDLAHLASAAESLRSSLKTPEVEVRGVTVDGDLAPTAATASRNLATASALGVIPLSVLVLVTLLSVVQLARLLSTTRESQAELLVARGASRAQVLVSTVVESAVVTLLGSMLGALVAWVVLQTVPAGDAQGGTVVRVALLSGLAVLVVLTAVAVMQVWRLTTGGTVDVSGRTRAATALATVVLVLGAAGVAWWQLRRTGSPLVTREDGSLGTDLVAGAAPALLLAAAAVVAMALLGPISRAAEALTRPSRRISSHLASAQVSRRLPVYAVPAVLSVLAVGATTLSGLYAGTSAQLRDNLAAVGQGAPVRASLEEPPKAGAGTAPGRQDLPTDVEGAAAAAPVWLDANARLGDLTVPLLMSPVDELAQVVTRPDLPDGTTPLVPVEALAIESPARDGVAIPGGTSEIEVALDVDLTITDGYLESVQRGYEQTIKDVLAGNYGAPVEDEDEAARHARLLTDGLLDASMGQVEWKVSLLLLETDTGLLHDVAAGSPVVLDLPEVVQPWAEDSPGDTATGDASPGEGIEPGEDPPAGEAVDVGTVDYTESDVHPGGGRGEVTFSLPEDASYTLIGVQLDTPRMPEHHWATLPPDVHAEMTARTDDGTPLFGAETADWGSRELAPRDVVEEIERENAEAGDETTTTILPDGSRVISSSTRPVPGELDTSSSTWQISARSSDLFSEEVTVGPGLSFVDDTAGPPAAPSEPADDESGDVGAPATNEPPIPVALTAEAARAASLRTGDPAELSAFGTNLPVRVSAVVPAVPGTLAAQAALVDRDAVAAHYVAQGRTLPYPSELWVMPSGDPTIETSGEGSATAVVEQLAAHDRVTEVGGPGRASVTDATSAARLVFWVASAGAVLLAVTGIAAVAATLLTARRPEVVVLRALGMPPRAQARSRAMELGGVVLASVLLGLGASWLVGRAVVPELARSTTLPGQVVLPVELLLEPGPWAVLLGAGAVVVLLVVLAQAGRVRAQALDNDYREEIR